MDQATFREAVYFALFSLRGQPAGRYYHRMLREDRDGIAPDTSSRLLGALLDHCARRVPYYAREIQKAGKAYRDDPEGYLAELPLLTKEIIRERFDELKSSDLDRRKWSVNSTGGSTGEPVNFIQDREYAARVGAVTLLYSTLTGWRVGEPAIYLWGSRRDITRHTGAARSRLLLKLSSTAILDSFVMTPDQMRQHLAILRSARPRLIVAYADAIYELACFAERDGVEVWPGARVISSAGMLYPFMREKIEKVFQTKVYNRYGSREVGDIACERPGRSGLWVAPWANYIEIIDDDGRRVPDGCEGEVAVTCLANYAMPLIRYRIGDRASLATRSGSAKAGNAQVLQRIVGRSNDFLRGRNGALAHGTYFVGMMAWRDWIRKYQVIQKSPSNVVFRMVPACGDLPAGELDEIVTKTRSALGDDVEVGFEFVDEIPTSASGKYRYVICEANDIGQGK